MKEKKLPKLGVKYGYKPRKKYAEILAKMRKWHKCPKCEAIKIKRVSVGIWSCRKCGYTFTGGAYVPFTIIKKS